MASAYQSQVQLVHSQAFASLTFATGELRVPEDKAKWFVELAGIASSRERLGTCSSNGARPI